MKEKKGNILIGVCGGIAVYKVCQLVRLFVKNDYSVKVMMTEAACQFIRPLLFKELTDNPVYREMFSNRTQSTEHIKLSEWADLAIIAPLSANTLSKLACGICDNLLTTVICALNPDRPVLLAPSMNENMWQNSIIQKNLSVLKKIKSYTILAPEKGTLACKVVGVGRMPEVTKIYKKSLTLLK
ncbi:MAG: hypothetical protein K9L61_01505 [Candidatus Omnitrophica bacterium]|nr:hypothetical protein [Candidatus Omnitrophota bacterium]